MRKIILGVTAALMLTSVTACGVAQPDETATCKVSGKDRVSKSDGGSEMRVYTDDCGTFVVADSLTRVQFRSADLYGKLQEGHTYKFTYHGWRNGVLSMFPNITEAQEVK